MEKIEKRELKVWIAPAILTSLSEQSLNQQMEGLDLRLHGGGTFKNKSFRDVVT